MNKVNDKMQKCSFCGAMASENDDNVLIQSENENSFICIDCIDTISLKMQKFKKKKAAIMSKKNLEMSSLTPKRIKQFLDDYIIGQEEAKKIISVAVYNHYKSISIKERDPEIELEKSNIIMLGPSGCGKTAVVKALSKMLNVPFAIADATTLTAAGYVGSDVEVVLQRLLSSADNNVEEAQKGIVYIDEIDKISRKGENLSTTADPGHEEVQQALLKIIEGSIVDVPQKCNRKHPQGENIKMDTSNILFIVGGAFEGIEKIVAKRQKKGKTKIGFGSELKDDEKTYNELVNNVKVEDLKKFGMIPELLGRLPIICTMKELDENALIKILTEPKNALIKQYKRLLQEDGVELNVSDLALKAIANRAKERKTGARSLRSILEEILNPTMFDLPEKEVNQITLDINNNDFVVNYNK